MSTTIPTGTRQMEGNCDDCHMCFNVEVHNETQPNVIPDMGEWDDPFTRCWVCGGDIFWCAMSDTTSWESR